MSPLDLRVIIPETPGPAEAALWCLEQLLDDDRFRVSAVLWAGDTPPDSGRDLFDRYLKFEQRIFGRPAEPAAARWARLAGQVAREGRIGEPAPEPTDVVVDFSGDDRAFRHAGDARLGVWRLVGFGADAGIGETARGAASTTVRLAVYDGESIHPRSVSSAEFTTKFIAARQAAFIREKSFALLRRELARACQGLDPTEGDVALPQDEGARPLLPYLGRLAREMAARGVTKVLSKAGRKPGQWCIITGRGSWESFEPGRGDLIFPEGNRYWADPFLFRHDRDLYLFFEDYDYATGRGHISVGRLVDGAPVDIRSALERPYHLSYPQVFRHGDDVLMIPETHQAGRVEVWRATRFPAEWELFATGLDGIPAADCGFFEDQGAWWLFANVSKDTFGDLSSELNLYRVSGPDLAWCRPHPLNPVVVGSRTARGGGRVFRDGDKILRASQNNTHGVYGWGLNIMQITRIDETGYSERLARTITPDFRPGLIGCHHFDADGDTWVIDARLGRGHWAG